MNTQKRSLRVRNVSGVPLEEEVRSSQVPLTQREGLGFSGVLEDMSGHWAI